MGRLKVVVILIGPSKCGSGGGGGGSDHIYIYVRGTFRYYVITLLSWRRRLNSLDSLYSTGSP